MSDEKDNLPNSDDKDFLNDIGDGSKQQENLSSDNKLMTRTRSPLWYELPLFFALIGGLIAYFKIRKDDPKKARNCLILGIGLTLPLVVVISLLGTIGFSLGMAAENPFYVVSSGSMEPNLHIFDVVTADKNFPFEDLQIGDIIVFNRPIVHDKTIVHRVVEIVKDNPLTLRTMGDANPGSIPGTDYPVTEQDYVGKVVNVTPKVGYITRILSPPVGNIIHIAQIIVLIIPVVQHVKYRKKLRSDTR